MKISHILGSALLGGMLLLAPANRAQAQDLFSQDLLANILYGLVLPEGSYGSQGPYGPYGDPSYDPYRGDPRVYGGLDRRPYYDPYRGGYGRDFDPFEYEDKRERIDRSYAKAMNRLERQEREAREKVYRKYDGRIGRPGFQEKMAQIDRKYAHKRWKVERNTAKKYGRFDRY